VQLIDRAVTRGALHRNAGARKKSQAAKLAARAAS
jgi:ribosomal protein S20